MNYRAAAWILGAALVFTVSASVSQTGENEEAPDAQPAEPAFELYMGRPIIKVSDALGFVETTSGRFARQRGASMEGHFVLHHRGEWHRVEVQSSNFGLHQLER